MAYLHEDFENQSTPAAKLAMLLDHIAEVRREIRPDVSDGEVNVNRGNMKPYLDTLNARRKELEAQIGRARNGGPVYVQKARPGPAI